MTEVYTLDLNFLGIPHVIASYLVKHSTGAVIVESGPGSTVEGLKAALAAHELTVDDVTDVLLTHIHLDHAGASGGLARHGNHGQGATIYVHPDGAPHLLNPEKLLNSPTSSSWPFPHKLPTSWLSYPSMRRWSRLLSSCPSAPSN